MQEQTYFTVGIWPCGTGGSSNINDGSVPLGVPVSQDSGPRSPKWNVANNVINYTCGMPATTYQNDGV